MARFGVPLLAALSVAVHLADLVSAVSNGEECLDGSASLCQRSCPDNDVSDRHWATAGAAGNASHPLASPCCPEGMDKVAPPKRSANYVLEATRVGGTTPVTDYTPGEQLTLTLRVTNSSAKYLGLLLYATNSVNFKVGTFVLPTGDDVKFWTPSACNGAAVTHTDAGIKRYTHKFAFVAPSAGTGSIKFLALVKHGETNGGAFYWPQVDVSLSEGAPSTSWSGQWVMGDAGKSCDQACAAVNETCNATLMESAMRQTGMQQYNEGPLKGNVACKSPFFVRSGGAADCFVNRSLSASSGGHCWYRTDNQCVAPAAAAANCTDVQPPSDWKQPTCEKQLLNTDNCRKRRAGTITDGYCHKTCGVCNAGACAEAVPSERKLCSCTGSASNSSGGGGGGGSNTGVLNGAPCSAGPWSGCVIALALLLQQLLS